MTVRNLKLVEPVPDRPVDITLAIRDEIKARNWAAVHIAADRRPFLALGETKKWRYS
jgi:flagellar basal body P-ring protein FlgI